MSLNLHAETIEFVVTASPGIGDDYTTRMIAQKLVESGNFEIVILNKPGASKQIGYNYITDSKKPTLFVSADTIYSSRVKDVVKPLFFVGDSSHIVLTSSTSNITSINDLIELTRKREIRVGHGGVNTNGYEAGVYLCENLNLNCLLVPYKSGPDVMNGLLSNTVDIFPIISHGANSFIRNDKFKALFVMSSSKHKSFDGVPTLPKKYKNLEFKKWTILFGKNLSEKDEESIKNIMKNLPDDFYISDLSFWYTYKDSVKVFNDKP